MAKKAKKKQGKVHKAATNVILTCLIIIFLVSAFNVGKIMYNYYKDRSTYTKVATAAGTDSFTGDIDFESLWKINPNTIAWIYLKDSEINYPIVKAADNDKYLKVKFDGEYGGSGTLFTDCATEDPFDQFNTIVYGHHMKDGSMFAGLRKFKDVEYEKKHNRFELITPEHKYHLDVIAFCNERSDSTLYQPNVHSLANAADYVNLIKNKAMYTTDVEFDENDKLVMLSTCAYEFNGARYIVYGKLVPWEENKNEG